MEGGTEDKEISKGEMESVALGVLGLRNSKIGGNMILSLIGMGLSGISITMFFTI